MSASSNNADLALDFEIGVAGRQFFLRRTLETARRIETVLGSIEPLAKRLEDGHVTTSELALLYTALLKDEPDAPSRDDLDAWIFNAGVYYAGRQVTWFVFSLICGNEVLRHIHDRIASAQGAARRQATANGRGPFGPTGGSIGAI